jgi:hypothetical protein
MFELLLKGLVYHYSMSDRPSPAAPIDYMYPPIKALDEPIKFRKVVLLSTWS